jgi:hypothetical protein
MLIFKVIQTYKVFKTYGIYLTLHLRNQVEYCV